MATKTTGNQPSKVDLDQGKSVAAHAINMALLVNKSDNLLTSINAYSDARELMKRGPLAFLFDLQKEIPEEELDTWPEVGSENSPQTPTNNPDVYRRPGTNAKGKPALVRESFFDKLADNTVHGREAADKIVALEKRKENKNEGIPAEIDADLAMWMQRKNAFRALFKTAMRIHQKWRAVTEGGTMDKNGALTSGRFPQTVWRVFMDTDPKTGEKKLRRTTEPFMVRDVDNPDNYRTLSIGMLLSLNPKRAEEAGGTVEAFMTTRGVEPETGEGDDITDPAKFEEYSNALASYLNDKSNFATIQRVMDKREKDGKTPTPAALEMIETVGDIYSAIDGVFAKYSKIYEAIADKRDNVANATAETDKAQDAA